MTEEKWLKKRLRRMAGKNGSEERLERTAPKNGSKGINTPVSYEND